MAKPANGAGSGVDKTQTNANRLDKLPTVKK